MPARRGTTQAFIGRGRELAVLQDAHRSMAEGGARTVLVSGESGVGKTRLIDEFATWASRDGSRVLIGGAVDMGDGGLPYVPLIEALRPLADDRELRRAVGVGAGDLGQLLPILGDASSTANGFAQARLFEQLLGLFARLAPLVLVVEDLQWADRSTRDLLTYLERNLGQAQVMLIGSYRTDELPPNHPLLRLVAVLRRSRRVDLLTLARFSSEEHQEHVAALLGEEATRSLASAVYQRSGGNPFFTEELLAEGEASAEQLPLPGTLRDLLLARYHASSDAAREVLRAAAVGGPLAHRLLAMACGLPDAAFLAALREVMDRAIMVADPETGRYAFRHALMAEAIYGHLLPGERATLHRRFARAKQDDPPVGAAARARTAAERAHHWLAAGDEAQALPVLISAGRAAREVHAQAEAMQHFERALLIVDELGPGPLTDAERGELIALAAEAAEANGAFERAAELWRRALAEVDPRQDPYRAAQLYVDLGETHWLAGDLAAFVAARSEAVALVPHDPPSAERAMVLAKLAAALALAGELDRARALCEEAIAMARLVAAPVAESRALSTLGTVDSLAGRAEEAIVHLGQALAMSAASGRIGEEAIDRSNLAEALHLGGRIRDSIAVVSDGIDRVRAAGLERTYGETMTAINVELYYLAGEWERAAQMAGEALERRPTGVAAEWLNLAVCELAAWRGDFEAAHAALAAVGSDGQLRVTGWTGPHEQQAQLALWEGRPADALAATRSALAAMADAPLELPGGRWLCALGTWAAADLAEAARARGDSTAVTAAQLAADELWGDFHARADAVRRRTGGDSPHLVVELQFIDAVHARAHGADADRWAIVADAWDRLDHVPNGAVARLWDAEARLRAGEGRAAAAKPLQAALATARRLGARPMIERLESLARRARIDVSVPQSTIEPAAGRDLLNGLTRRESQVLRLLVQGRSNAEIARELFITIKTVSVHITNIKAKFGARSRVEVAAMAIRLGLG